MDRMWKNEKIDTSWSKKIMDELSKITDNPHIGGRAAGSPAEHRAADYLTEKFREAGLVNVTKDPCPVDTWIMKEGKISWKDAAGNLKEAPLGGYACNAQYSGESFSMVYAGKGTEADYEKINPAGKLVLIEINQAEDWWINFPAYEAKERGAAGVICMNTGGFGQEGDNVLVSEDLCGPSHMMAFSIGQKDGNELKNLISRQENQEFTVILDIDSIVKEGGVSYNIWGDIPGKTEQVIYVINHYDSYYYTVFDDVQGIGWALGLAKAFTERGIRPEKTIRFVAHGAEEWGITDCKYDWATGAYRQITQIRPEWKDTGLAVVNLDGFYAVKGERKFCVVCTQELYDFVREAVENYGSTGKYEIEVNLKLTSSTEDFSYTKAGIPSFVAGAYDGCLADRKVLHSSDSSWEAGFDDEAFSLFHSLFAHIISNLDKKTLCPINLKRRLSLAFEDLEPELAGEDMKAFKEAISEADRLNKNIEAYNSGISTKKDRQGLDQKLRQIYRELHEAFIRLNWNDEMITPHQRYKANLTALDSSLNAAEKGNLQDAAQYLMDVDFNYYAAYFSESTYTYFEKQVTEFPKDSWGTGLIEHGNENLFPLIRSLLQGNWGELQKEQLLQAQKRQNTYLKEAVLAETDAAKKISREIAALNKRF